MSGGAADLVTAAKTVLAAWDRIEEAKAGIPTLEARLEAIQPHKEAFQSALDAMRDILTESA